MVDDAVAEFVTECLENLDRFERGMLTLERDPNASGVLDELFRAIHTIKGTSGFFDFPVVARVSHAGEDLLSAIRDAKVGVEGSGVSMLLEMSDLLRRLLVGGLQQGQEAAWDDSELVARLAGALAPRASVGPLPSALCSTPGIGASIDAADRMLRVDVGAVDRLMDLAGEIVLARNEMVQFALASTDLAHQAAAARLVASTSELQARIMATRMQPISTLWSKLPRLVRDVARQCNKQVRLECTGGETELDRSVVDAIKDPLTHLVRNSIDHGIALPADRVAAGKPAEGTIVLRAGTQGGQVVVEIADDGVGIDPARVLARALEANVVTPAEAAEMTRQEILHLVLRPGFSTAETVSSVSGRGVGMDVVKTNIERLGGVIEVESEVGRGTTIRLTIPLTLAIAPALVVGVANGRYAILQSSLVELVSLEAGDRTHRVERIQNAIVLRLRGRLIPLLDLRAVLACSPRDADEPPGHVVVLEVAQGRFGLLVDAIADVVDVVVKPLAAPLQSIDLFAGGTILGDGIVTLILDVVQLSRLAAVRGESTGVVAPPSRPEAATSVPAIVARLATGDQVAIAMRDVGRIERVDRSRLERAGGQRVVRVRDTVLWCTDLAAKLGLVADEQEAGDRVDLIVVEAAHGSVGLVVSSVVDVAQIDPEGLVPSRRAWCLGTTVVCDRVTEFVDLGAVL